jgi:hypothetical protein
MQIRVFYLIAIAAAALHESVLVTIAVCVGYGLFAQIDEWMEKKKKTKALHATIANETDGWVQDPEDASSEEKGDWSRFKLPLHEQRLVNRLVMRVGEMLQAGQ